MFLEVSHALEMLIDLVFDYHGRIVSWNPHFVASSTALPF